MSKPHPIEDEFCLSEGNADLIADLLVGRLRKLSSEMEAQVNRLYRGRSTYDLGGGGRREIERSIQQLDYMARTLREVQAAQAPVRYLAAAE